MTAEFELPWPPSVNHYYRHVGHRVLISRDGRRYRENVAGKLAAENVAKFTDPVALHIELYPPDNRRRDVDNSLKCLPDTFTHGGLYADDSLIYKTDCHQTGTNATGRDGLHKDRTMERRQNGGRRMKQQSLLRAIRNGQR